MKLVILNSWSQAAAAERQTANWRRSILIYTYILHDSVEIGVDETIRIALCMGSSCFARGNNLALDALERIIADNNWQERIHLSGLRCENRCAEGPNITIDGVLYQGLDLGALMDLLADKLGVDPAAANFSSIRRRNTSGGM